MPIELLTDEQINALIAKNVMGIPLGDEIPKYTHCMADACAALEIMYQQDYAVTIYLNPRDHMAEVQICKADRHSRTSMTRDPKLSRAISIQIVRQLIDG